MTSRSTFEKKVVVVLEVLLAFLIGLFISIPAYSQVTGATLSGTITDASGGVIAGAQISVRNTATGITKDTSSDSNGYYAIPNLPAGNYEVKVTASGFSTSVQSNLTLAVGAQQTLNFTMKVGAASSTVHVTESAPQIDLSSSSLTGQVESRTVLELPLNGRDWTSLATLHPGVALIETQMSYATSARGNRGFGAEVTISGQRTTNNNYRLDGISINDYANSGPGNVLGAALGVDAILEFSVLTGGFPAEYGKASGGILNAITKSGTNAFHGDVYEFLRNSALDSRDYFSRSANNPKAAFRRNQFGVAAGGPIIKDKTFIFGDYEGLRQAKGIPTVITVPSEAARGGTITFSGAMPPAGCIQVLMTQTCTLMVDPAATAELAMFPHATPGTTNGDKGKFIFSGLQIVPENFYTVRVDHRLSTSDSLFGTYLFDDTDFKQPDSFNNVFLNSHTRRQTIVLEESHTFTPSFVNAARVGFARTAVLNLIPKGAINPAAADLTLGSTTGQTAPTVAIGGFTRNQGGVGSASNYEHHFNNYQLADDAFWTHGAHTIKFGTDIERMQYNFIARQNPGGRWNFTNLRNFLTNNPKHFEAGIPAFITPRELRQTLFALYVQDDYRILSNLTLNLGLRYEMVTVPKDAQGKLTNLLHITDTAPQCGKAYTSPFMPRMMSPPGTVCASVGPYFNNPTTLNFEPRIGFAWDPFRTGKTSVRGGFGIYDVLPLPAYFLIQQNQAAPFMIFSKVDKPASGPNPLAGQFSSGGQNLLTNPPPLAKLGLLSTSITEHDPHRNYVLQWNLNVQRQILPDMSLTVGYVGSHAVHMLIRGDDGNMTQPTHVPEGWLFPCGPVGPPGTCSPGNGAAGNSAHFNQSLGIIRYLFWGTDSFYHGLGVNLDKRLSHGLQFQVAYTWSKSIDDNSSTIAGDTFENGLNSLFWTAPRSLRGRSDFQVGQTLSINGLWAIPVPRSWQGFAKGALDGWQLGSIFKYNSGVPTTVIIDGDPMGLGNGGSDQFGIPNRVAGCNPINPNFIGGTAPQYINVNCYALPTVAPTSPIAGQCGDFAGAPHALDMIHAPDGTFYCANLLGNAGRNTLLGPSLLNTDFSVFKNFLVPRISETFKIQFRAEIFNIFNRSNFVPPGPYAGATLFNEDGSRTANGTIDSLASQPRDIQFALKIIW